MKILISICCLFLFTTDVCCGQIINTIDSIGLYDIGNIVFDKFGNIYFNSILGNQIGKVDTNHVVTIIAGNGTYGFSGDGGSATNAELAHPQGIVLDNSNNIYIADQQNQRIRKVDLTTGLISTVAGTGSGGPYSGGFSGDNGPASAAQLNNPTDIKFDNNGNLYIADSWNYRIRKIDIAGIITTVAGNGISGKIGNDGSATNAELYYPSFLAIDDSGNLYVASSDYTIRRINSTGIINAFAGDTSSGSYNGDNIPATNAQLTPTFMTFNSQGLLTISDDGYNFRIRLVDNNGIIHTIAGNGVEGSTGDGGPATAAELDISTGIVFDTCGNLYIAQVNQPRIRKVFFNPACWPEKVPELIDDRVVIHPNPARDVINVDNVKTQTNYALVNIVGIIEQSGTLKTGNNSIAIQSLPPGMYLLELTDNEARKTIKKIIKE